MRIAQLTLIFSWLSFPAVAQETTTITDERQGPESDITLLAGSDYVSGEVNGQDYETFAASAGIAGQTGRFSFAASIPYVVTSAPEELIVSNGGVLGTPLLSQPSTQTRQSTREGVGDLVLQGGYSVPLGSVNAFIGGNLKVPTASREKALGTGKLDYGVSGQVSRQFGRAIPFVSASYTMVGEPEGFDVRNILSGSAGAQFILGSSSSVTLDYSYDESATRSVENHQSVGVGLAAGISSDLRLGIDARAGLTEDAPDARIGVRLGVGF
ncbi:hypothetical protein [Qipengyuania huizhouensis]|uniref:hypothetical protein n=1 Tax=Qipengyuania huizhouensis TaxID=2867245 RepID=UPI001C874413|nr:hypothetical protein [Qipengyuania huizhouensis]MBX7459714.1 hypothetical protein [Qipengyuania huizhouensis]